LPWAADLSLKHAFGKPQQIGKIRPLISQKETWQMNATGCRRSILAIATLSLFAMASRPARAADAEIMFDLPDTIECRDVTPKDFVAAHPSLKVIEAKFRISARMSEGAETDIVDFLYIVTSPGLRLKVQDYLPNTTLESTMADDRIEVTATTEHSNSTVEDAHVAYKVLALGGSNNDTSKKSESDHYKEIVPKALVLASGTMNREHGVFFKLRPSKGASLEGAKAFTFLAVVPKDWRGDWCVISCAARAKKKSFFSTSVAPAGIEQAHVGLYLSGDREARFRAEELCETQEANGSVLSTKSEHHAHELVDAMHAATDPDHRSDDWLHSIFSSITGKTDSDDKAGAEPNAEQRKFEVQKEMADVQDRLNRLSGSRF
jgi:hypothetical protein